MTIGKPHLPQVSESISDPDQANVRSAIARRADEARITSFATAALTGLLGVFAPRLGDKTSAYASMAWQIADAMEAEWQRRFKR